MQFPPHLPPPICSIARHRQWRRLKIIGVSTFFGLLAGLTGAAMLLGWIWPGFGEADIWFAAGRPTNLTRLDIENQAQGKISEKLFSIYSRSTLQSGVRSVNQTDYLTDGVVGVNSGWLIAYLPSYDSRYQNWVIVGPNGILYHPVKILSDKRTGVVYLKISRLDGITEAEQFKVATFTESLEKFDDVFVRDTNQWHGTFVLGSDNTFDPDSQLDSTPSPLFALAEKYTDGAVVIDKQGNAVGFVVNGTGVLPLSLLTAPLNSIEDRTNITHRSLGLEGWYSDDRPLFLNGERLIGFYVNRVLTTKTTIRRGDVIVEINGRPMTRENLWYNISEETVRVKVLRSGKELELETNIVEI